MAELRVHSVILAAETKDDDPRLLATFTAEIGPLTLRPCRLHFTMAGPIAASLPSTRVRSGSIRFNSHSLRRDLTEAALAAFLHRGGILPEGFPHA